MAYRLRFASRPINAANTFAVDSCFVYASPMHQAQNCPSMIVFSEMEQVNAFNDFRKQSNRPNSETYNSRWCNHPNFSWKQNQPTDQGGASHQSHNQYLSGFPPIYQNHGCSAQPVSTSAPQAPASSPQSSLEDTLSTLNTFIQSNGQMVQELKNSTMINS